MRLKIFSIITVIFILVSMFCFSVSAEINIVPEYPFPNCSDIVRNKEYVLWITNSGVWRLAVWNKGETRYLVSAGAENRGFLYSFPEDIGSDFDSWVGNKKQSDYGTFYEVKNNKWQQMGDAWVSFAYLANTREYYSSQPLKRVVGGQQSDFFTYRPLMTTMLSGALLEVHSLIPYLVLFLIGFLVFWKAWQFLLTQLRKA